MPHSDLLQAMTRQWRNTRIKIVVEHRAVAAAIALSWVVCYLVIKSANTRHGEASFKLGRHRGPAPTVGSPAADPVCKNLYAGWHLPAKSVADEEACAALPIAAVRIDNAEFSICARTEHNVVDNYIKGTHGYWIDCEDIVKLLENGSSAPPASPQKLSSKGLVVDVGANIGACAIWMAARGYDVIAFEPKPVHIAMLKATAALRPEVGRRITLHEIGLSDEPAAGAMLVSEDSNSGNSWIFKPSQQVASTVTGIGGAAGATVSSDAGISLGRLDDYCAPGLPIDVLKVDTQGFEGHVFRGAVGLMRSGHIKRLKFEYWPFALRKHGSDPVQVLAMLHREGFALFDQGKKLEPARFQELTESLCSDNSVPGCKDRFTDLTGVWEGTRHST